jgi:hypothetical protein
MRNLIGRAARDRARGERISAPRAVIVAAAAGVTVAGIAYKALRS